MADQKNGETVATILIIGAGVTGLTLAQGLKKAGIPCIVYEKYGSLDAQPRDWNMGLHWGVSAMKDVLTEEKWDQINAVQVDHSTPPTESDALPFLNAQSGEVMTTIPVPWFYRLRRSKLRKLLSQDVNIQYQKTVKDVVYSADGKSVTAYFEDGTSAVGRLLVGADGARSTLRKLLLGPVDGAVRKLPYAATFIHSSFTAEQALYLREFHPLYVGGIHPNNYFAFFGMQDAPDPSKPETWKFFFYISWPSSIEEQEATASWTEAQRLQQVKEFAKSFTDPWKSAFEWTKDDRPVWYMGLTDFDPGAPRHRWSNHGGRVTMAGDAVHPMTYQRGQGLNHSVTDVAKLVEVIKSFVSGEHEQSVAISAYEEEVISRGGAEVRLSTQNTEMLHDWNMVLKSPVLNSGLKPKHS